MGEKQYLVERAEGYFQLASGSNTNPVTAAFFRLLAADFLAMAERASQQRPEPMEAGHGAEATAPSRSADDAGQYARARRAQPHCLLP